MSCFQVAFLAVLTLLTFGVVLGGGYYVLSDSGLIGEPRDLLAAYIPPTATTSPESPKSPSATTTPKATEGVALPPTWTPTPTHTEVPIDPSGWLLSLDDLTAGFEEVPMEEFGFNADGLIFGGEYPLATVFSFLRSDDEFEGIFGFTILIEEPADQAAFDANLQELDLFSEDMRTDLSAEEIFDQRQLSGISGIGDASTGVTVGAKIEDVDFRLDIISFRRGAAGVFLVAIYLDEDTPVLPVQDAARTLDSHILRSLTS
ncbi:MAG: hypothetical protein GTO14_10300 [Anaerolineales bacterium]|nr:hypothetical protein [Anaerolineales bacterium]